MKTPLYVELARLVQARLNCIAQGNQEWLGKHEERIVELVKEQMPSGSGFDYGTKLDYGFEKDHSTLFPPALLPVLSPRLGVRFYGGEAGGD